MAFISKNNMFLSFHKFNSSYSLEQNMFIIKIKDSLTSIVRTIKADSEVKI